MTPQRLSRVLAPRLVAALTLSIVALTSCATDVRMKPRSTVSVQGTILDPTGKGISNLDVFFGARPYPYGFGGEFETNTDSTGSFTLILPEGVYFPILNELGSGGVPRIIFGATRVSAPRARFDYAYGGHRVSGLVTGPGGAAVDSGIVNVIGDLPDENYVSFAARFAGGRYEVYVPTGNFSFYFRPGGPPLGLPTLWTSRFAVTADTTIDVALDGNTISGTVSMGPGVPLSGATVQALGRSASASAETGTSGDYVVYLPSGDYDWKVDPGPSNSNVSPLTQAGPGVSAPTVLDFDLSGVSWTGTVRVSPSGTPVSGAQVAASTGSYPYASSTTDGSGQFHVVVRPSIRYTIYVSAPGMRSSQIYGVLAGNDSTFDVTILPTTP
jgi:hypothetical protein